METINYQKKYNEAQERAKMILCNISEGERCNDIETIFPELAESEDEKPSEDLEEAADNHIRKVVDAAGHPGWDWTTQDIADAFIAGAEWQKKHDAELIEIAYNDGITIGKTKQKDQMTKDAVEGEIGYWNQTGLSIRLDQSLERLGYGEDTEVKVIIVKQDDRPRD